VPLPVRPEAVEVAVRGLKAAGFLGWNVTIPHKEAMLGLMDEVDAAAERMGAVNTVLVKGDGRLRGLNTDGYGFIANLEAQAPGWREADGPAVLIGTGGAARAIAVALIEAGIEAGAKGLRLVNRTKERAERLAETLQATFDQADIAVMGWEKRAEALEGAGLCVNCTSLGMKGQPPLELVLDALPKEAAVVDIVYVPLETPLLAEARARGHPVVDGLGMLLHQAVPGFRHWGGAEPTIDPEIRTLMLEAQGQK